MNGRMDDGSDLVLSEWEEIAFTVAHGLRRSRFARAGVCDADIQDIVQDSLLKFWEKLTDGAIERDRFAYLVAVIRNQFIQCLRDKKRHATADVDITSLPARAPDSDASSPLIRQQDSRTELVKAADRVSGMHGIMLSFMFRNGAFDLRDARARRWASHVFQISYQAVDKHLQRGLRRMRELPEMNGPRHCVGIYDQIRISEAQELEDLIVRNIEDMLRYSFYETYCEGSVKDVAESLAGIMPQVLREALTCMAVSGVIKFVLVYSGVSSLDLVEEGGAASGSISGDSEEYDATRPKGFRPRHRGDETAQDEWEVCEDEGPGPSEFIGKMLDSAIADMRVALSILRCLNQCQLLVWALHLFSSVVEAGLDRLSDSTWDSIDRRSHAKAVIEESRISLELIQSGVLTFDAGIVKELDDVVLKKIRIWIGELSECEAEID